VSRAWVGLAFLSLGCGSPSLTGGETAPSGREPPARRIASFLTTGCVDSAGGPLTHRARVFLTEDAAKRRVLVVARASQDSLVLRDPRSEAKESVFQAILEDTAGVRVLHDYRLPEQGGAGRMAITTSFTESPAKPGQVSAQVGRLAFACRLTPEERAP